MKSEEYLLSCCGRAKEEGDYGAYLRAKSELADFYREAFRFEEALTAAEDVLMLLEELNLEESESFALALIRAAAICREAGREEEALRDFTRALRIFETVPKPDDGHLASLEREIGFLLQRQGEPEKAAACFTRALSILEKRPDAKGERAEVKTDLALLALQGKEPQRAQALLEEAIAEFSEAHRQEDVRYSAALAGLGEALFSQGRLEKALEAYGRALVEIESRFGKNESYALLCGNCAAICRQLGETKRADGYERAAALREKD